MANKNDINPFSRSDSEGLGWADQWDYKFNDDNRNELQKSQPTTKKEKMQQMNKKAKAAASTGFAKAKVGASIAATKIKSGSSAGVSWVKQQIEKRKTPK